MTGVIQSITAKRIQKPESEWTRKLGTSSFGTRIFVRGLKVYIGASEASTSFPLDRLKRCIAFREQSLVFQGRTSASSKSGRLQSLLLRLGVLEDGDDPLINADDLASGRKRASWQPGHVRSLPSQRPACNGSEQPPAARLARSGPAPAGAALSG